MDIQTQPRHRHFVVLPLCLAVVASTVWAGASVRSASLIAGVALVQDSQIVRGASVVRFTAGGVDVLGFVGSFRVSLEGDVLSVAALTTSALIRRGELRLLVPVGYQGQWQLSSLPVETTPEWLADEMQGLRPVPAEFLETVVDEPPPILQTAPSASLLSIFDLQPAPEKTIPLEDQIAASANDGSALIPLLTQLHNDDLLLVLSLHPSFRDAAWTVSLQEPTLEPIRLLSFPPSDTHTTAASKFPFDRWEQGMQSQPPMTEALLRAAKPLRERAIQREYPERLQRYAQAILGLADQSDASLSDDARNELSAWRDIALAVPMDIAAESTPAAHSSSSSVAPLSDADAAAVVAAARQMLFDTGALLTLATKITATDAHTVLVDGILFAGSDADHVYQFQLNLQTKQVQAIIRDGTEMPFPMGWEAFTTWTAA